jgi:hypothetical protein
LIIRHIIFQTPNLANTQSGKHPIWQMPDLAKSHGTQASRSSGAKTPWQPD